MNRKEQVNGVLLEFNSDGFVSVAAFEEAVRWHCPYCTMPSTRDAIARIERAPLGNNVGHVESLEMEHDGVTYVHPQVILTMCSSLERPFTVSVMKLMLRDHGHRHPGPVKQLKEEDLSLQLARERTKQMQIKGEATKKGISALENYTVSSRPDVVSLVKSLFSGFGDVEVNLG